MMMEWTKTKFSIVMVTKNQQIWIKKTCWRDFASRTGHIVLKVLSKVIICYLISLRFVEVSWLLTYTFIATTLHDVLDKNRYPHNTS